MIILSRKMNEQIVIGKKGEVVVTVVAIRGGNVRLGIEAPNNVPVHRQESHVAIQKAENLEKTVAQTTPILSQQPIPIQSESVQVQETSYQQFVKYLNEGNLREAGKIYVGRIDFEASHEELDKLTKGLYRIVRGN